MSLHLCLWPENAEALFRALIIFTCEFFGRSKSTKGELKLKKQITNEITPHVCHK